MAMPKKQPRCKAPPEPTRDEYRAWWLQEQRRSADLQRELNKARATVDALAWVLSMKPPSHVSDDDIPF